MQVSNCERQWLCKKISELLVVDTQEKALEICVVSFLLFNFGGDLNKSVFEYAHFTEGETERGRNIVL